MSQVHESESAVRSIVGGSGWSLGLVEVGMEGSAPVVVVGVGGFSVGLLLEVLLVVDGGSGAPFSSSSIKSI